MALNSTQMTMLQGVNVSLGTTAFVVLTTNIADAVKKAPTLIDVACLLFYIAFLIFWVAKIFIQNHVSFATAALGSGYRIFQFFITIVSFLLLIVACEQIGNFDVSSRWLLAHFAVLLAWLVGLAVRLGRSFDRRQFPWHWTFAPLDGVAAITALHAARLENNVAMALLAGLMFFPAIYDARVSRTFAN